MELRWLRIEGFRRFKEKTTLNTSGKLVALVGPNEAGKSSTLDALEALNDETAIAPADLSQRGALPDDHEIIEAGFILDESDAAHLPMSARRSCLLIRKRINGRRSFHLWPDPPQNLHTRSDCIRSLKELRHIKPIRDLLKTHNTACEALSSEDPTLDGTRIASIRRLHKDLSEEESVPAEALLSIDWQATYERTRESGFSLKDRIPRFKMFSTEDRNLSSKYHVPTFAGKTPPPFALRNLCLVSGLDLERLHLAISENDVPRRNQALDRASEILTRLLQRSWTQGELRVQLSIGADNHLEILIIGEGGTYVTLDRRSDGMRRFLALLCFLGPNDASDTSPVVLLDEAESQLHYDAQAELVQVLSVQSAASKVVYATHSMGCLPNDLGGAVRYIRTNGDTSVFVNNLWTLSHASPSEGRRLVGFEPLLYSMGATRLAFVPMRPAVIVEGISDMILLPAMFQHAADVSVLQFQIVGGLSQLSNDELRLIQNQGLKVLCVVDSDRGGKALEKNLRAAEIPEDMILSLPTLAGQTCTLEDLVDKSIYIAAANSLIRTFQPQLDTILETDIGDEQRAQALDKWCSDHGVAPLDKKHVAAQILEEINKKQEACIVSESALPLLRSLFERIEKKLCEEPRGGTTQ